MTHCYVGEKAGKAKVYVCNRSVMYQNIYTEVIRFWLYYEYFNFSMFNIIFPFKCT